MSKDFTNENEVIKYMLGKMKIAGLIVNGKIEKATVDKFVTFINNLKK